VFFYNGLVTGAAQFGGGFADIDIMHMSWNGAAWSTPVAVAQCNQKYEEAFALHIGDNDLQLMYPDTTEGGNIRGGNISIKTRTDGVWGDAVRVKEYEHPRGLDRCISVRNARDDFRFMFLEGAPSQDIDGIDISDDLKAGYQRIYAYGVNGLLGRVFTRSLSLSTNTISAGRSVGDIVALIQGDHPRYTYEITNDPFGVFEIDGNYLKLSGTVSAGTYSVSIQGTFRGVTVNNTFSLTCADVNSLEDKKVLELKLDEGSGNIIADSSYYGFDGVLGESAMVTNGINPAWVENGLDFSGSTFKKTTVPYNEVLDLQDFHLIFYAKSNASHNSYMVSRDSFHTSDKSFNVQSNGYNVLAQFFDKTLNTPILSLVSTSAGLVQDTWKRIEVIVSGTSVKILSDGTEIGSDTLPEALPSGASADFILGCPFTFERNFNGSIGYVALYDQELTGADLTAARAAADAEVA
jgi:hypothetical protein